MDPASDGGRPVRGAWSETGPAKVGVFETRIHRSGAGWGVTGRKFYTTGSLFADWIDVVGTGPDGEETSAIVAAKGPGLEIVDDWDGFGQRLTASGSTVFDDADVLGDPLPTASRFSYGPAFFQPSISPPSPASPGPRPRR